ncbi:hypothetical protein C8Q77DRAFT_1125903 [Trametes polyzona]|nr:hypothetical protein C8Q77DRAFT_1125903 [Trametes polyzona]
MDSEDSSCHVPRWIETHSELQRRGIVPPMAMVKPGVVYRTLRFDSSACHVIKILNCGPDPSEESEIHRRLQHDTNPRNPVIPCEVIESGPKPILVMPYLADMTEAGLRRWSPSKAFATFLQVVEGVEYLHERRIAHLDICDGNILMATNYNARQHNHVVEGKVYLIDFQTSRQLPAGPGVQGAITLPVAHQFDPPFDHMDPYSWDVYCLGKLFEQWASLVYRARTTYPWYVYGIRDWLVGNEEGCTGVCSCRPTVRRARQVLAILGWCILISERCGNAISWVHSCLECLTAVLLSWGQYSELRKEEARAEGNAYHIDVHRTGCPIHRPSKTYSDPSIVRHPPSGSLRLDAHCPGMRLESDDQGHLPRHPRNG